MSEARYLSKLYQCYEKIHMGMPAFEKLQDIPDDHFLDYHKLIKCIYDLCDSYTSILILFRGHPDADLETIKLSRLHIDLDFSYHLFYDDASLCLENGDRVHIPKQCADFLLLLMRELETISPSRIARHDLSPFIEGLDYYRLWVYHRIQPHFNCFFPSWREDTLKFQHIFLRGISHSCYANFSMPEEVQRVPDEIVYDSSIKKQEPYTKKELFNLIDLDSNNYKIKNTIIRSIYLQEEQAGNNDDISKFASSLSDNLMQFKKLLSQQIDNLSNTDLDMIIQPFVDICTQMIYSYTLHLANHDKTQEELRNIFGCDAWNKLQNESKEFLISARTMYESVTEQFDYSAVCLLVCKALEVELRYRLFTEYQRYLTDNNIAFPESLKKGKKNMQAYDFTLGSVQYILCIDLENNTYKVKDDTSKKLILDYMKNRLMKKYSEKEIQEIWLDYAKQIDWIKKEYRNKAAHSSVIKRLDAEKCLNLVVYIEKLLCRMLDSFEF